MIRLWLLGLLLLALTMAAYSLHVPGALGIGSIALKTRFVEIGGISTAVFLLAVLSVTRPSEALPRNTVWGILLIALAMRLPLILGPPFLSTDVYRYVWDGRVQALGVNPYRYMPADPALESLRDAVVYPKINRAEYAPTIYPPAAQLVFAAVGYLWSSVTGIKATMVGFEVLAIFCLLKLLATANLPAERIVIYAWNPLPVWAFAGNGHIDAAVIGLLATALLLRVRQRDGWAGMALGLAILMKFLPAVVAPVLWRRRTGWRTATACVATIIILYGLYSGVGLKVLGFLQTYGSEEGYDSGLGFWLLAGIARLTPLQPWAASLYKIAVVVLLAGFAAWFAFIRPPQTPIALCGAAGTMMALLTFAISPHYPWYFAWLAVPCVLAPSPAIVWLSVSPILLYLDTFGDRLVWPSVVYAPALLLTATSLRSTARAVARKGTT